MLIEQVAWESFLHSYALISCRSAAATRRMIDDDFRMYWTYYEAYERALADGSNLIASHYAMGRVLQRLTGGGLFHLDEEIYPKLISDPSNRRQLPLEDVRAAMAPLRTLSIEAIAEAESRLGPIPALDAVPLLDEEWLAIVASEGRERPKTTPAQLARQREMGLTPQEAKRITIADVGVALATIEIRFAELRAALERADFGAAERSNDGLLTQAFRCRAVRTVTASHNLQPSLLFHDQSEAQTRSGDLETAWAKTLPIARTILAGPRSGAQSPSS